MRLVRTLLSFLSCIAPLAISAHAIAAPLRIVAAESVYGDVARQIAGADVQVTSILTNPDQDPHLFEASPSVARELSHAGIVIANGAAYDPWMQTLLRASPAPGRTEIDVATLVGAGPGSNPHLWYDLDAARILARRLAIVLDAADPARAAAHDAARDRFLASLAPVEARLQSLRSRVHGTPVSATEPVFGLMARSLGLDMRNQRFQIAVMNDSEPRPSDVAAFEQDLRQHRIRLLIENRQASDGAARRLVAIAHHSGVPTIGVSETEPAGTDYQHWMMDSLDAVDRALSPPPS